MASSCSASSSSSGDGHDPLDYAEHIARAQVALATVPEELCPPSRPSSPLATPRTEGLKQAIMDAVLMANSNPTHPKWGHLTRMVKLHCTRRGYVGAAEGVRIGDVQKADLPQVEWTMPETEDDWERYVKRWGRKFNSRSRTSKYFQQEEEEDLAHTPARKAQIIREKVVTWQAKIIPMEEDSRFPLDEIVIPPQDESATLTTAVNNEKAKETGNQGILSQSSLGFAVVKRSATVLTTKAGRRSNHDAPTSTDVINAPKSPSDVRMSSSLPESAAPVPVADVPPPVPISSETNAVIAEVSEMSFLPPSFPSQLRTSTPLREKGKAKPPPIMPSSPLSSPPPTQHNTLPSLASPFVNKAKKRGRNDSPRHSDAMDISNDLRHRDNRPLKKSRTALDSSSSAPIPPPSTPPPLASSASNEDALPVQKYGLGNAAGLPIELPTTPERQALPTLTELLASSRRSKARPRPPSRKNKSANPTPRHTSELPGDAAAGTDREPSPARTFFSSPASGSSSSSPRFRARSPVSPLFSQNPNAFAPAYVSSQPGGFLAYGSTQMPLHRHGAAPISRGGSGMLGLGYNSQFDLEGGISRAAELLDRDVDYADWLRDIPEVEDEAVSLKQSQGEVAV